MILEYEIKPYLYLYFCIKNIFGVVAYTEFVAQ